MHHPERIGTGVKNQTIAFPHDAGVFDPKTFDFKRQTENYKKLSAILAKYHVKFDVVGVTIKDRYPCWREKHPPEGAVITHFVAYVSGNETTPLFIWQKYESGAVGSGQNVVYVNGQKFKMADFLSLSESMLDEVFGDTFILRAWVSQ